LLGFSTATKVTDLVIPIFLGTFLWQIAMFFHKPMEFKKQTKPMLVAVCIALVTNILVNVVLIPVYGLIAAAYATILGSAVYILLNCRSLIVIFHPNPTCLLDEY
jgi:O-antigen/teichoic acid export membrane protein